MVARKRQHPSVDAGTSTSPLERRGALGTLALGVALALAVVLAHWPVLHAQALALDDDLFVARNPLVQRPGAQSAARFFAEVTRPSTVPAYYLPLSMTSLMLDWAAGGRPGHMEPFHVTSLALHVLATLLLFLIVRRLLGCGVPAALAALLYGVHPLMVEAIASAGERKTVLATALAFASVYAYVRHAQGGARRWQALSLACFGLALLSKPSVLTLPLALVVLDVWPLRRRALDAVVEKWPWLALSVVAAVISFLAVRNTWEFGALPPLDPLRMIAQMTWLQGFYLEKVFWPARLSTVYAAPAHYTLADPAVALPWTIAILAAATCIVLRKRAPGLLVGALVGLVLLAPTFAILRYSKVIAYDRYMHLPAAGLALALAACITPAWSAAGDASRRARVAIAAALVAVAICAGAATRATLGHWKDTLGLWTYTVGVSPGVPDAWNGLGVTYSTLGEHGNAVESYRRAVAADPDHADAHQNLGRELTLLGRMDEALPHLEFARSHMPGSASAVLQLGLAYQRLGRLSEAGACYQRALAIHPDFVAALIPLGSVQADLGRRDLGMATLRRVLVLSPGEPLASVSLASLIARRDGPSPEVVQLLRQAGTAKPGWAEPVNELAWLLATAGEPALRDAAEALRLSERALSLTRAPDPNLLDTRAAALAAAGRFEEALATGEQARSLALTMGQDSLEVGSPGTELEFAL